MEAAAATAYTSIVFGDDKTEKAYRESRCRNFTDFLSSPTWRNLQAIDIYFVTRDRYVELGNLRFWDGAREEGSEEGIFLPFLRARPTTFILSSIIPLAPDQDEVPALCQAIASPLCTLQELLLYCDYTQYSGHSDLIADALFHNTSLQKLIISSNFCIGENFVPALISHSRSTASSLKSLQIDNPAPEKLLLKSGLFVGLANNTISLHQLAVLSSGGASIGSADIGRQLGKMLLTNSSLTSLSINEVYLSGEEVVMLFTSLEKNLNLTSLSLWGCYGKDWPSISTVLDCLRINGIITRLELHGTPLHGQNEAAIKTQLAKNRANVENLKVLKSQGSHAHLVQPTTVRLFLCGLPYSGKSTLSRSLANWDKHTQSSLTNLLSRATLHTSSQQRTRGIEVTNLEKDGVKVSLWDLAGQEEFYSFHDYMLPNLTNEATPSMFLFVWNPIQVDQTTGRELKDQHDQHKKKSIDRFSHELNYWLMFVASKTLKSVKFRPKVLVAITRADRKGQTGFTKKWIEDIFHKCQEEFKDYLDLDIDGIFEVDARYPHKVQQLARHIFDSARSLLHSVPLVYKACDDARRLLTEMVHIKPLMTKDQFFSLCHRRLGTDTIAMQEAITYSLNESGDLIYFDKSSLLVVVDVKWFCHHIMGSLLHFGKDSKNQPHQHGVFPLKCLEDLLEKKANSKCSDQHGKLHRKSIRRNKSQPKINGEDLVKLLLELELACQQEGEPGIFIPGSLRTGQQYRSQIQPRHYLKGDRERTQTYMGRRLRYKDTVCTFFTPGFFPALQVMFKRKHGELVTLKEDVIAFARAGVEVFMEFCHQEGERQFIDILIQSHLDLDQTIEWMREEILERVENVRAGARGLKGVELAHEVIQPACVEKLICMDERKTLAVSVEELRDALKSYLEKKGSLLMKFEDCLKAAYHTWHADNNAADLLIHLLGSEETWRIVQSFRQKLIMDVDDALGIDIEREITCSEDEPEKKAVFSSTWSGKERELIYNKLEKVDKNVQEMRKDVQKILSEMDDMRTVVLSKVQERMQELLKFSKEGEAGRLPRFFFMTKSQGKLRRIVAAMVPGLENVRLELLCEHGLHLVPNQCGLQFETLEDGLLKRGLPYIITVLKVARLAMRVGAHVLAGFGDAVPDFTRVLALIEDTPKGLPTYIEPDSPFKDISQSRTNFQEGQQWLRDILSKHECLTTTRIHEVFGLTCVRYPDSTIGWLCDEHRSEGEIWLA